MADQSNIAKYENITQNKPEYQKWISNTDFCLINVDINIDKDLRSFKSQNNEKRQQKKYLEIG